MENKNTKRKIYHYNNHQLKIRKNYFQNSRGEFIVETAFFISLIFFFIMTFLSMYSNIHESETRLTNKFKHSWNKLERQYAKKR